MNDRVPPHNPESRPPGEVELSIVVGVYRAAPGREEAVAAALARYVVTSRAEPGCRNIDLVASATAPGTFLVYEKWDSYHHQRAHFDGENAVLMAQTVKPLLAAPPELDLFTPISAHDLL